MQEFSKYIQQAKDLGAKSAALIPAASIVTAEWVRLKCQYGCGGYGHKLTCPPNSPTPETTRKMVDEYHHALLIHGDEHTSIQEIVATLEREIFWDGYHKAFGMGCGPCSFCRDCPEHCRHPRKARPSMEACGIDVFSTVKTNGFPIEVLRDRSCEGNYYGLILID